MRHAKEDGPPGPTPMRETAPAGPESRSPGEGTVPLPAKFGGLPAANTSPEWVPGVYPNPFGERSTGQVYTPGNPKTNRHARRATCTPQCSWQNEPQPSWSYRPT